MIVTIDCLRKKLNRPKESTQRRHREDTEKAYESVGMSVGIDVSTTNHYNLTNGTMEVEMAGFPSGTSFLFVGKLRGMTREQARALVEARGGVCPSALSEDLDYLVVGDEGSPFYGGEKKPKQLKAEDLIESGARIAIITETEFMDLLDEQPVR